MITLESFAASNLNDIASGIPGRVCNLVNGEWESSKELRPIVNPLNKDKILFNLPATKIVEMDRYIEEMKRTPKSGLHNIKKNTQRFKMLSKVVFKVAAFLSTKEGQEHFIRAVQLCMPKSYAQAYGEVVVTTDFLKNFTGDRIRFLHKISGSPGDRDHQMPNSYRWPFGATLIIYPFNFPLEIAVLQVLAALFMGNRVTVKSDSRVALVMYEFIKLLHDAGLPKSDIDFLCCTGEEMDKFVVKAAPYIRLCQFTGSSQVAERVSQVLNGKVREEDSGFDWKILGPDVPQCTGMIKRISYQSDQDAFAASGQKCSAQSILFKHVNWNKTDFNKHVKHLAERRKLSDLTLGPVLSWTTQQMLDHIDALLKIEGSKLLFGGKALEGHNIPEEYGAIEATSVFVPFDKIQENFDLVTTEVFGPVMVSSDFDDDDLPELLTILDRIKHNLTAAIVSNDPVFQNTIIGSTVNGTTYVGYLARTTGAPQNHWFGPSGNAKGAGIGTDEAIKITFSTHREVVFDEGDDSITSQWQFPLAS